EDGFALPLRPALLQEPGPIDGSLAGVDAASVDRQKIDRPAEVVVRADLVALQHQPTGEGVDSRSLCVTVEISEHGKRFPGTVDGAVGISFQFRESGLARPEHASVDALGAVAEQPLGQLEMLAGIADRAIAKLDAGGEQIRTRE